MLKEIYHPNEIPAIFSGIEPVTKIKTKFLDQIKVEHVQKNAENPVLIVRYIYEGGFSHCFRTIAYKPEDIISKKGMKEVVPVILVLEDFNKRLYLGVTYVKFYAPDSEVLPNQLEIF